MHKICFFSFCLLLFAVPSVAEDIELLTNQNAKQQLAALFSQAMPSVQHGLNMQKRLMAAFQEKDREMSFSSVTDTINVSQQNSSAVQQKIAQEVVRQTQQEGKPWQMALFLAASNKPIDETIGSLRWAMRHGYLYHATLLDTSMKKGRPYRFYYMYRISDTKTELKRLDIDAEVEVEVLLESLFEYLETYNDSMNTKIFVDAHGGPSAMWYDSAHEEMENSLTIPILLDSVKEHGLHVEVLDLLSCHQGTMHNVNLILDSEDIDYVVVSSEAAVGSYERTIWPSFYSPKSAAVASANWARQNYEAWEDDSAINAMALDIKKIEKPLQDWFSSYSVLCRYNTPAPAQLQDNQDYSFRQFVKEQQKAAQHNQWDKVCDGDMNQTEMDNFLQKTQILLESLDQVILGQWCMPPNRAQFYTSHFKELGCMDGPSIDQTMFEKLLDNNRIIRHFII